VHHEAQLEMLERHGAPSGLQVWLKADSGMGRAGFALRDMATAHARLVANPRITEVVLMTHFARADEPSCPATAAQISAFDAATQSISAPRSLCNSAGVIAWGSAHSDWARPGIMLYGISPIPGDNTALQPVMTLQSEVFATRVLQPGDPLGYGAMFTAERPTRVGLVAMGYADGYPRRAPTGTPVMVDGSPARLIGRVSMDMLTIDLTDLPDAGIGSTVELWGPRISVDRVAQLSGTIPYELLCNVKRVRRMHESQPGS